MAHWTVTLCVLLWALVTSTGPGVLVELVAGQLTTTSIHLTNEELLTGDWTRGKAGTGEVTWDRGGNDIWEYKAGAIAESWDFSTPGKLVYHIRQGVHWALNPNSEASRLVNGRELNADDVVFSLTMLRDHPVFFSN